MDDRRAMAQAVDTHVIEALETLDYSPLTIMGNGELTVVLGWPSDDPEWVLKPTGPFDDAEYEDFADTIATYANELTARNVGVIDTEVVKVTRADGQVMSYMVQPVLARDQLAEHALATFEPDPENPILVGIAEAIGTCDGTIGIDAPISNWSFDGERVHLLDLGLPLMWDEAGTCSYDAASVGPAFPAPLRKIVVGEVAKIFERYRDPRVSAVEFVGRLPFFGYGDWVEPAAQCMNQHLDLAEPVDATEAAAMVAGDSRTIPLLKRIQRAQRMWERRVRRRRYEYFIGESTY